MLDNEDPNNDKDMALLLEYLIPNHNASVSLLYVYGRAPTPQDNAGANVAGAGPTRYHRFYLFGDYTFEKIGLRPPVGFSLGIDKQAISGIGTAAAALVSANNSLSWFSFLELDQRITDNLYALGRFDYDDVTNKAEGGPATARHGRIPPGWYGGFKDICAFPGSTGQATTRDSVRRMPLPPKPSLIFSSLLACFDGCLP